MGQLAWYVARSTGLVAWALLTASVLWGVSLSGRVWGTSPKPNWLLDLHRYLGGLATIFVGVHVAALVADNYTAFGLVDLLVPFASAWRPGAVAWGVAGLYLLVAVEVTSLVRNKLPKRVWRAVHMTSFPLYAVSTLHLLQAGTDADVPLVRAITLVSVVAVVGLTAARIAAESRRPTRTPPARPASG